MPTRRTFVKQLAGATAACGLASLPLVHAESPTGNTGGGAELPVVAAGEHRYRCDHAWAKLPDKYSWQTTHNVAVDKSGLVYIIHEGRVDQRDHPSIFVFDPDGKFVRAFGQQFQGGGHGIEVRNENGEEFLYVACYLFTRSFAKLTLTGDVVWHKFAPMEAGGYAAGESDFPHADREWGRDRFNPTNFAFHPDGGFYLADGYGSFRIHRYDADANWLSSFGRPSDESDADGTFDTPHGIWIDDRPQPEASAPGRPTVLLADRANSRLQWFTLEGQHLRTQTGFLRPANCDIRGELLLVPDLIGRVTLLDGANNIIGHFGDDSERITADAKHDIREDQSRWLPGKFVHPHDAAFDAEGNILVTEWVQSGRVTKLIRVV